MSINSNSCLVCAGKKVHYNFSVDKFRVEECVSCGLMRLNPQPDDQALAAIYSSNYLRSAVDKDHTAELKTNTAEGYLDLLESYHKGPLSGHLLEIGCGQGEFLASAEARGLVVKGIAHSEHAAELARSKLKSDAQIICGEISQLTGSGEQFDYIFFTDVLERIRNPRQFMRDVHSLLKKDGVVVVVVPSLDSFSARFMKNKWVEFKPEHHWYFSTNTLRQLLYSENFNEVKGVPAKKTLSPNYIMQHFNQYPVKPYSTIIRLLLSLLPNFFRKYPVRVAASEVIMFAKKGEILLHPKLSIVMAVYNEASTLRKTLDRVLAKNIPGMEIELIIVESNSTDGSRDIINDYINHSRVKVIWQDSPRGKGNAIRAGLEHITGDFVLIQDADDEYDLEDYETLIEPLVSGEAAFVLGARHGGKAWKMRQFQDQKITGHLLNLGHWGFTWLINLLYGVRLKDPFTMYKVFRTDCLNGLSFECDRFDFDCELLIKLLKSGYQPIEIPINYRSRSFKEGKKVTVFRDPWTWLCAIVKFRLQKT